MPRRFRFWSDASQQGFQQDLEDEDIPFTTDGYEVVVEGDDDIDAADWGGEEVQE